MVKKEIELTERQLEKVEILESKDISVGDAIDFIFDLKNEFDQSEDKNLIEKMNETGFDLENKTENLKKNFNDTETYDITIHGAKHGLKWSNFFKF